MDKTDTEQNQEKTELDESRPGSAAAATAITQTDQSVSLMLPISRRIQWMGIAKDSLFLVIMGIVVSLLVGNPSTAAWGVLAGIVVGVLVVYDLLTLFVGTESLEVNQEMITLRHGIWGLKRSHQYPASRMKNLRCADTQYVRRTQPLGPSKPHPGYVLEKVEDSRTSAVVCDYDGQLVSLLGWIEKPLAKRFVSLVKRRFVNY